MSQSLDRMNAFSYLAKASSLLGNPAQQREGRDMIIRALDDRERFIKYDEILRGLVRKAGLFSYLSSEFQTKSMSDKACIAIYSASPDFVFNAIQYRVYKEVLKGNNVVLSAPTSMGKSAIIDHLLATKKFSRVVVVVPTIALIDETRRRIAAKFSDQYEVIHHNSQRTRSGRRTVYILTQERVNERQDIDRLDLFVIDEFYKLKSPKFDDERAVSLNFALSKLLATSKQFFFIGPNIDEVKGIAELGKPYFFVPASFNTVAVDVFEYNLSSNDRLLKLEKLASILHRPQGLGGEPRQTLIYCQSSKSAGEVAEFLVSRGFGGPQDPAYVSWICRYFGEDWSYTRAIKNGIGIHHGALPRALQQYTTEMFNAKKISILICTSTIIEGVNTNAEVVVIFDGRNGQSSLDRFTHNNIQGRAGRMRMHFIGEVHCMEKIPKDTLESRSVEVALGLQNDDTPVNFLAGIEKEHLRNNSLSILQRAEDEMLFPMWLVRKHATISIHVIKLLQQLVDSKSRIELKEICRPGYLSAPALELLSGALGLTSARSLRNIGLHAEPFSHDLYNKLRAYLYAPNHQQYFDEFLKWLSSTDSSVEWRSAMVDRELKFVRNLIGFAVPKALSLLQDLINIRCEEQGLRMVANFGMSAVVYENNHLPTSYAALEEMGIPVSTLEKLESERLASAELNTLVRFLRRYASKLNNLTKLEKHFVMRAVAP